LFNVSITGLYSTYTLLVFNHDLLHIDVGGRGFDVGKMINDLVISISFRRGVMKKILIAPILSMKASSSALAFSEVEK